MKNNIDENKLIPDYIDTNNMSEARKHLMLEINNLVDKIEELPSHAIHSPINHYDLLIVLRLLLALLRCS